MSILTPEEEAEYWASVAERELAVILKESMYLAADQHQRRAYFIMSELNVRGYRVVRSEK